LNPYGQMKPVSKAATGQTFHIAALLPLSGPHAHLGDSIRKAMELGLFGTPMPLEITFVDTGGTPEGATRAIKTAKYFKAKAIVGPLFAHEVRAVSPHFQAEGIPVLALSNDRRVAQPGVFTLGSSPLEEVRSVLSVGQSQGISEVTVLLPRHEGHEALKESLDILATKPGMPRLTILSYQPEPTGFSSVADQLKGRTQDALLFMEGGTQLDMLVQGLQQRGVVLQGRPLLGLQGMAHASSETLRSLQGAYYALGENSTEVFEAEYLKTFRETPPKLAILGLEAVQILAHALADAQGGSPRLMGRWPTVAGEITLLPTGETGRSTKIYQMTAMGSVEVQHAQKRS
ncbi:MAG: penicillin-binding protein activator, partial [Holosporales bacterium]